MAETIILAKPTKNPDFDILNPPPTKVCCDCGKEKPRSEFRTILTNYDNKDVRCKECGTKRKRRLDQARKKEKEKYSLF
jgi:hypothetical protein